MLKGVPHSWGLSLTDVKVKSMWPPSQAYFLCKRRGVGPLCHPMPSWICVNTLIPCPGVVDKEGADTVVVHSSQTIIFQMMIMTSHFFYCIEERSHVFIPLKLKNHRDTRPLWRMAFFSYFKCGMGMGPGDLWSRGHSLYCSGPCLCHHKSIISNASTSVEYCASNRVLPCCHPTFCSIITQGRSHNLPQWFNQEC